MLTQNIVISETTLLEGHHSSPGNVKVFPGDIVAAVVTSADFSINPNADVLAAQIGAPAVLILNALKATGLVGNGAVTGCGPSPNNPKELHVWYWCNAATCTNIQVSVTFQEPVVSSS